MTPGDDRHASSRALLHGSGVDHAAVLALVRDALDEDLAWGPDVTTQATTPATVRGSACVVAHAPGTVAGLGVAAAVVETVTAVTAGGPEGGASSVTAGPPWSLQPLVRDGERVTPGQGLLRISGALRPLLTAERTLLNLLCQLSGVATETARWVDAVRGATAAHGGPVAIRDTRKTVPGLRVLQKYAVRCGGGVNHRMGLGDAALIKDNHVVAVGSVAAAFRAVRAHRPEIAVEVECDTLDQVREALAVGADLLLLDNMTSEEMRTAVELARPYPARLEASGGLTLAHAAEVAATGVDYIAIGALTHSAPALDLGLDLESTGPSTA